MTDIEWTDSVWNCLRGCARVSTGCEKCYAERQAHRFSGKGGAYEGLTQLRNKGPVWTGEVRYIPEMLTVPLRWKKKRRVFVNSMSDVFHESVDHDVIDRMFAVMAICQMHETIPAHEFQLLTKRAERMRDYMLSMPLDVARLRIAHVGGSLMEDGDGWHDRLAHHMPWPLPNVWMGVSVEDQKYANARVPHLLKTPASVRFVSAEPLLGPVVFHDSWMRDDWYRSAPYPQFPGLDWIIVGGESGPGARPFNYRWAEAIVAQCKEASVACFVKQVGSNPARWNESGTECFRLKSSKGGDPSEWPEAMRVRQWPEVRA